jgi:tetratricopeptide (TPR) repeat protein
LLISIPLDCIKMSILIVLFLLFSNSISFAESEIGFKYFKRLIYQNMTQKLKIIDQDPLDAESYFNLGLEYMALGRTEQEIQSYIEAIHLYENYSKAHFNLAIAFDRIKKGEKAIKHLIKAEKIVRKRKLHVAIRRIQRTLKLYYQKYRGNSNENFIPREFEK